MSRICLHCEENETPDGHNNICDPCYDNAGNYLEQNVELIKAIPDLLETLKDIEAQLSSLGKPTLEEQAAIEKARAAIAKAA